MTPLKVNINSNVKSTELIINKVAVYFIIRRNCRKQCFFLLLYRCYFFTVPKRSSWEAKLAFGIRRWFHRELVHISTMDLLTHRLQLHRSHKFEAHNATETTKRIWLVDATFLNTYIINCMRITKQIAKCVCALFPSLNDCLCIKVYGRPAQLLSSIVHRMAPHWGRTVNLETLTNFTA